jgi:diguanylate cyclase (GGDEF)-like protein
LARAAPIFHDLRREYGITHLYFTRPDRVNLLRVHKPERHGDVIERFTQREAERRGVPASGVELGPLGLFTLRVVAPWRDPDTRRLLGYVELGMEIDHVLEHIREILGAEVFVLIDKRYLQRRDWEQGTRAIGRVPDWERLPGVVVSLHGRPAPMSVLMEHFARHDRHAQLTFLDLIGGNSPQRALFVPLPDAGGRTVAEMALLVDVSRALFSARQALFIGTATALFTGGGLFAFFFWLIGRIGRRLEHDAQELERLAVRDGLTGLFNHRTFYRLLEGELARARRFRHPVSLLMLDLDHFKQVNDRHGHLAGDRILAALGQLLSQALREVDSVCRYGGEEFVVILPVTGPELAAGVAERLRAAVQAAAFDVGEGRRAAITLSIGVATFPDEASAAPELVAAADRALYRAKQDGRNRVCRDAAPVATPAEA